MTLYYEDEFLGVPVMKLSSKHVKIHTSPLPDLVDNWEDEWVGPVAAVLLDAEDEIPGPVATHRLHKPPAQTNPPIAKKGHEAREGEGRREEGEPPKVRKWLMLWMKVPSKMGHCPHRNETTTSAVTDPCATSSHGTSIPPPIPSPSPGNRRRRDLNRRRTEETKRGDLLC
nr:unnamed protein product [Digitaria exilis]